MHIIIIIHMIYYMYTNITITERLLLRRGVKGGGGRGGMEGGVREARIGRAGGKEKGEEENGKEE